MLFDPEEKLNVSSLADSAPALGQQGLTLEIEYDNTVGDRGLALVRN